MDGLMSISKPGEPELPSKSVQLLLPPGEQAVNVSIVVGQKIDLLGEYKVYPRQRPYPIGYQGKVEFTEPNPKIYSSNKPFPEKLHTEIQTQYLKGHSIVLLNIFPVQYIPASGKISYFTEMRVLIETEPTTEAENSFNHFYRVDKKTKSRVKHIVDNPEQIEFYPAESKIRNGNNKYVIITSSTYSSSFASFADFKTKQGYNVLIKTVEDIYSDPAFNGVDNQDEIRNFIKYTYLYLGTEYVLLGGDVEIVPHRGFYVNAGGEIEPDIPADLYYAALDRVGSGTGPDWDVDDNGRWGENSEADYYAEVYIGRISADSGTEFSSALNKQMMYQQSPVASDLEKAIMAGELLDSSPLTWGGTYKDQIKNGGTYDGYTTTGFPGSFTIQTQYERDGSWSWTDLRDKMNAGTNIINHHGHSSPNFNMKFYRSYVTNSNLTSNGTSHNFYIIYTQGCYPASFDNRWWDGGYGSENGDLSDEYDPEDCIAEKFTTISNGCVAFIGNSRYGWYLPGGTDVGSQYLDRQFFDALFGENIYKLGEMNDDSKEDGASQCSDSYFRWSYYTVNLLGDPSLDVWTDTPGTLTPSYADTINTNETQLFVNVGVNGALVGLSQDGNHIGSGITDASGNVTIIFDNSPSIGTMDIYVSAHNYSIHTGTIEVVSTNPVFYLNPTSIDYGDVIIGNNSTAQFIIQNTGGGTLSGDITTPTGYTVAEAKGRISKYSRVKDGATAKNTISYSLTAGQSQTYNLTFAPPSAGSYNDNVVITSNDPAHTTNNLAVTGTGLNPADITVTPSSFSKTLPPDNTTSDTLFIGNTGDVTLDYTATVVYAKGNRDDLLNENFDSGIPGNWTIIDGYSDGKTWYGATNYSGNTLEGTPFAFVNSNAAGYVDMDEQLITPEMDVSSYTSLTLEFDHYFEYYPYGNSEKGDVDVWDGSNWQNVARFTSTTGSWATPDHQTIDILAYANANLKVRFHYYDANWDWYWAVDNVVIGGTGGTSDNWLTLNGGSSVNGSIPGGGAADEILVGFDSNGLSEGTYNADIVITSNDPDESPYTVPVTLIVSSAPTLGNLDGYVTEYGTKAPIENAVVTINTYSDTTDASGYYLIEDILVGTYDAICIAPQGSDYFDDTEEDVEITNGFTTQVDFGLMWAEIETTPTSFNVTLNPDATTDSTLTIINNGPGTLEYAIGIVETAKLKTRPNYPSFIPHNNGNLDKMTTVNDPVPVETAPSKSSKGYEIYYDDGTAYNAWAYYNGGNGWGVRFTVSPGQAIYGTKFHIWDSSWPDPGGNLMDIAVYDNDGAFGAPGTLLHSETSLTVVRGSWNEFTWTPVSEDGDGEFYIFYIQNGNYPDCPGLSIDEICDYPERMWAYIDGVFTNENSDGDWLFRALTEFETDWITLSSPFAGTVPGTAKGSVDVTVHFDATGLENETKTANIVIVNNSNYSAKGDNYIVPVTMNVNPAQPTPPDSVNIEIVAGGDSVRISWHNKGYIYCVYSNDNPYAAFPGISWANETPGGITGSEVIISASGTKKFYIVTASN